MNSPSPETGAPRPLASRELWVLSQAATGFLWGVPAVLVFAVYTLQIPRFARPPVWWLFFAQGLVAASALRLAVIRWEGAWKWRSATRWTLFWALAALLQSPYLHWWQQAPARPLFTLNLSFALCFEAALLFQLTRWSAATAVQLEAPALAAEARLFGYMVLWLLGAPLLAAAGQLAGLVIRHGIPPGSGEIAILFGDVLHSLQRWIILAWIVPVAFTVQLLWKVRHLAVDRLLASRLRASPRVPDADQKIV